MKVHPATYVKAAFEACEAELASQRLVMSCLLHCLDYDSLTARASRDHLLAMTGLNPKTLKKALKELRDSGEIWAVSYGSGGRNRSPNYTFPKANQHLKRGGVTPPVLPEKGGSYAPPLNADEKNGEGTNCDKGGVSVPETGGLTPPPNHTLKNKRGVAGRDASGDTLPDGGLWETVCNGLNIAENSKKLWIDPLAYVRTSETVITLLAPTRFHAEQVRKDYGDEIRQRLLKVVPELTDFQIQAS